MNALEITESTCVGHGGERPQERGNCFSVRADDGKHYRIANFNLENLEALVEKGLKWPIPLKPLSERTALIHDPRIGERWYQNRYCEICTPRKFWPPQQLDARERQVARGEIIEHERYTEHRLVTLAEFS